MWYKMEPLKKLGGGFWIHRIIDFKYIYDNYSNLS
jgi:hypothetical protein